MTRSISPRLKHELQRILICLSLANLLFVRRWYELRALLDPTVGYLRDQADEGRVAVLVAISIAIVTWAAAFRALWWGAGLLNARLPVAGAWSKCGFLLLLAIPLELVRRLWNQGGAADIASNAIVLALEALLLAGAIAILKGNRRIFLAARRSTQLLAFLFPLTIVVFWANLALANTELLQTSTLPISARGEETPRLIWLLLDEFDDEIAFGKRPESLDLPALDRLRAEAMVATEAARVARLTLIAIPSLISGRVAVDANALDANRLALSFPDGTSGLWSDQDTVFHRARNLNLNTSLTGWYHPYCRILGDQVSRCLALATDQMPSLQMASYAASHSLPSLLGFISRVQWEQIASLYFGEARGGLLPVHAVEARLRQQDQYRQIRDHAYAAAVNPDLDFIYGHFPTPHMFPIYNRGTQTFELDDSLDYMDNLALADRTVAELRANLEDAGLWNRTSILITADHGMRRDMWKNGPGWTEEMDRLTAHEETTRVPFILKLAGDDQPVVVSRPFSSILSGELALAVLTGQISTNEEAKAWLETQGGEGTHSDDRSRQQSPPGPIAAQH